MRAVTPFSIDVPQSVLDDLNERIRKTRWTDEPVDAGWNYGTNPGYLRELTDYWINKYNWRNQEAELNKFNHFKTEIDGIGIHFIYEKGKGSHPVPLILTHGWPDSFYRFYKVIPMLTNPERFGGSSNESFDVIVPSIPGFGFSDKVAMSYDKISVLWKKLMTDILGYESFLAAGGDLGTRITKSLAISYPENVAAIHLTDVGLPNGREDQSKMTAPEQEFVKFVQNWIKKESGYAILQSTKPQTLGYGLNDSPVGLASWIIEKFYSWSDSRGNPEKRFTKDELLTNIMIYWVTQTINTSIRMYLENARVNSAPDRSSALKKVDVPTGVAVFPPIEINTPVEWAERMVNLKRFTKMSEGGHFSALEVPELYVKDLREFFTLVKGI
jgi:pimeloyl-ACP methyl ester carboxylesterase